MNRLFSIIIAGALVFIGVSAVMDKKEQEKISPTMAVISDPITQAVSAGNFEEEKPVQGVSGEDQAIDAKQITSSATADAESMTRDEQVEKSIRDDLGLSAPEEKTAPVTTSTVPGRKQTAGRVYSDEEEWAITSQTQNDLTALGNLINN